LFEINIVSVGLLIVYVIFTTILVLLLFLLFCYFNKNAILHWCVLVVSLLEIMNNSFVLTVVNPKSLEAINITTTFPLYLTSYMYWNRCNVVVDLEKNPLIKKIGNFIFIVCLIMNVIDFISRTYEAVNLIPGESRYSWRVITSMQVIVYLIHSIFCAYRFFSIIKYHFSLVAKFSFISVIMEIIVLIMDVILTNVNVGFENYAILLTIEYYIISYSCYLTILPSLIKNLYLTFEKMNDMNNIKITAFKQTDEELKISSEIQKQS